MLKLGIFRALGDAPSMERDLGNYASRLREMGLAAFRTKYTKPALVRNPDEARSGISDRPVEDVTSSSEFLPSVSDIADRVILNSECEVFLLVQVKKHPHPERVNLGRGSRADVRLPHNSISKLHAYIATRSDGSFALADAGSRNGTYLRGERGEKYKRLLTHRESPLHDGSQLRLGRYGFVFHTPKGFVDKVARYAAQL
ncbi:MAG: FHA domain-containing protein [Myxococcota bacterium]